MPKKPEQVSINLYKSNLGHMLCRHCSDGKHGNRSLLKCLGEGCECPCRHPVKRAVPADPPPSQANIPMDDPLHIGVKS